MTADIQSILGPQRTLEARNLDFSERTLPAILKINARSRDKTFIKTQDLAISYKDALDIASLVAGKLHSAGLNKSDRIVVLLPNCIELMEVFLGAGFLGAIFVPINVSARAAQLHHQLELAEPKAIVTTSKLLRNIVDSQVSLKATKTVWVIDDESGAQLGTSSGGHRTKKWDKGIVRLADQNISPSDPLAVLYTSGTTGPSKGVVCSHSQFFWWGILTGEALGMTDTDTVYTSLPMFHTNALNCLWQVMVTGATYCFGNKFSASRFMEELRSSGATITYMLGSMVYIMLKQPPSPLDKTHKVRVALSPATSKKLTRRYYERFGICLIEGYGSTETNFVFSNRQGGYEPGSMGRPLPEFEIKVVDEFDQAVRQNQSGELLIRNKEPYSMCSGYFRNPEATVASWRNLWFHTGDRVRENSQGVYFFLDRIKDSIRRRGENISSWEVEQALISHPMIQDAAVIGVPSELGEEDVMAFLVPSQSEHVQPRDLVEHLKGQIAYFAIPKYYEFVDALPTTENGKAQKYILKARGVGPQTIVVERRIRRDDAG